MSYRDAPRVEPVQQLVVESKRFWGFLVIIAAGAALVAWLTYGSVRIECRRPAAGEPARCSGATRGLDGHALDPFTLERTSFVAKRSAPSRKGERTVWLATHGGSLGGPAITYAFALRVEEEAKAFFDHTDELEWRADRTNYVPAVIAIFIALAIIVGVVYLQRPRTIAIDPNLRMLAAKGDAWPLDDIDGVDTVRAEKADAMWLNLVVKGRKIEIAWGSSDSVTAAAEAIRRAKFSG